MVKRLYVRTILTGSAIVLVLVSQALAQGVVAEVNQIVETDGLEIRVYQGKNVVRLPSFRQLLIVTPLSGIAETIEGLVGRSVAIVPSKRTAQLGVYLFPPDSFVRLNQGHIRPAKNTAPLLSDDVFIVKKILVSSPQGRVELKLARSIVQVKTGQALMVLGNVIPVQ